MKHKVFKLFVDFEKEERWLNEMSAKGLQFSSYYYGQYVFEEGEPGEYTYRMEMMESDPRGAEGLAYIRFMEDAGVECVDTFWRWAYFRKKTAEGPFDLFTDAQSRIRHYSRIATGIGLCAGVQFGLIAYDVWILHFNVTLMVLNVLLGTLLWRVAWGYWRRIAKLKDAMRVRE